MATSSEDIAQATANDVVPQTDGATAVTVHYDATGPSPNAEVGMQHSSDMKPPKVEVEFNLDKLLSRIRRYCRLLILYCHLHLHVWFPFAVKRCMSCEN